MAVRRAEVIYVGDAASIIRASQQAAAASERAATAVEGSAAKIDAANAATARSADQLAAAEAAASKKRVATAEKVGAGLNRTLTKPILGVAAAGVYMSVKFGSAMEQIRTQSGASQREVDRMSKSVLGLARSTEQGPVALAKALFELESVGLRGARAMATLKQASELAAVGGSDLQTATSALASTMVAFQIPTAKAGKTAATLNAIVGAGKMHMQDLTDAMGTRLPGVAKTLGVNLKSVGAAIASFTDQGVPAAVAAQNLVTPLLKMSVVTAPKAVKALASIGLGTTSLANDLRSGGISKALADLHTHLEGLSKNQQTSVLANAFGGSKGSTPIMQMLAVFDSATNSVQARQDLIGRNTVKWTRDVAAEHDTASHKIKVAWSSIQASLVQVGQSLQPVITQIAGAFSKVSAAFAALSPGMRKVIVDTALVVAAIGPMVLIGLKIAKVLAAIRTAFIVMTVAMEANPFVAIATVVLALGAALVIAYKKSETFRNIVNGAFGAVAGVAKTMASAIRTAFLSAFDGVVDFFRARINDVIGIINDAINAYNAIPLAPNIGTITPLGSGGAPGVKLNNRAPSSGPSGHGGPSSKFRSVLGAGGADKVPALLYSLDAMIAKLQAKMVTMQAGFDRSDARATKAGLIAAVRHARSEPLFTVSRNSSGGGVNGMSLSGSSAGGGLAWAEAMVGHFKESTGKNTGPELDRLQKTFGTHAAAWCAEFATTALVKAGAPAQIRTARVAQIRAWASAGSHGFEKGVTRGLVSTRKPRAGDLMMFGDEHVGVVESVKGGKVHTIEGNTSSGQVSRRTHNITDGDYARAKGVGTASLAATVRGGLTKAAKVPTGKLTVGQIRGLAYAAGFRGHDLDVAVAIAEAESGGDTTASNRNSNGSIDRGLFQINSVHGKQSTFNPMGNAKAARAIEKARGSFKDWVTYNTGAYKKFMGHTGHGTGTMNTGAGSSGAFSFSKNTSRGGDISSAVKALKDFNLQAARAAKLAAIQVRINGLEKLKAWRDALKGIATDLKGKVTDAVDAFQTKWEATFGVAFDNSASAALDTFDAQTQSMVENGPAAQALAALQAQEDAINIAAEDAANAQGLADAKASGDPRQIAAAQAQIAETARQRGITAAQKAADDERTAIEAQRVKDRQALQDQQAADRQAELDKETAAFKVNLTAQLAAEQAQLKARTESYAQFAHDVDAILKAAGIAGITTDAGTEATIAAGPGAKASIFKGYSWANPWGKAHATGGLLNYDVIHRVGELGPENIVMSSGGPRVVQASQSGGSAGGGGVNFYGPVTIGSTRAARVMANDWAYRMRHG